MKNMVRAIKMEYDIDASTYGLFNLQYSDGEEFYKDRKEIESPTWLVSTVLKSGDFEVFLFHL